jgi:arginyl-tRNA--protein-N-Asp/Glu arginylyltransferase
MTSNTQAGQQLDLYISSPQACDYLADKQSRSIFISPDIEITPGIYQHLIGIGFRRSGKHAYRPHCEFCRACISSRINVHHFQPSRSQKRVLIKNSDLSFKSITADFSDEHFELYSRYQSFKHPGGTMEDFNLKQYQTFLCESFGNSLVYETRLDGKLVAVSVTDVFDNSISAVYTFFDPDLSARSLGTYSVLQQINTTKSNGRSYVYLGYYIKNSGKMSYKANFRPLELLVDGVWQTYEKATELPFQSASLNSPLTF